VDDLTARIGFSFEVLTKMSSGEAYRCEEMKIERSGTHLSGDRI